MRVQAEAPRAAGYPRQALLMTIVRDLNSWGHYILTVETDAQRLRARRPVADRPAVERDRLSVLSERQAQNDAGACGWSSRRDRRASQQYSSR